MYSMQNNGQFCSAPQAQRVHQNKCIVGAYEEATKRDAFSVF